MLSKRIVFLASALLIATAVFHLSGYREALMFQSKIGGDSLLVNAIPFLWLFPTIHWISLALMVSGVFLLSQVGTPHRIMLVGSIVVLLADAFGIYTAVGAFAGV